METIRIGIIGLHNHYHAYPFAEYLKRGVPGLKLVAVSDERANYAADFAREYGAEASYKEYQELLQRDDIDAVIITSYTSAHAEQVEACAKSKRHILLDKPISTTMVDAERIVHAAKENGVVLLMAYLLRYLPAYQKMKQLVDKGAIGTLTSAFYSIRIPAHFIKDTPDADHLGWYADPIKGGGGGFLDHAVHFTDWTRWFFGQDAVDVNGRIASLNYTDLPSKITASPPSVWKAAQW